MEKKNVRRITNIHVYKKMQLKSGKSRDIYYQGVLLLVGEETD